MKYFTFEISVAYILYLKHISLQTSQIPISQLPYGVNGYHVGKYYSMSCTPLQTQSYNVCVHTSK